MKNKNQTSSGQAYDRVNLWTEHNDTHCVRHRFLQKKKNPRGNTKHTSRQHITMCAITIHLANYLQQIIIYYLFCILKNYTYPPIPIMYFIVASCQRSFLGPSVTIMYRGMWVGNPRKYPFNRAKNSIIQSRSGRARSFTPREEIHRTALIYSLASHYGRRTQERGTCFSHHSWYKPFT